ncbi:transposase is4 [Holotrichia oblita]|uniref:Transposase is4 n=1 Tax=Holotrichia oblita TaxID=644536 RepID=A0ACB9TRY4_HOLOL|nr:transposase is4 [Holotrichia oblita]
MARDEFFQVRSNLHCVNNLELPENCQDRLYKVRPLYDAIRKRCLELDIEENLCIDAQMVPFRGNISIKQYVKGKPTPWGVKIFVLCGKSGMAYDFVIYQGATTGLDPDSLKKYGLGASVILHLVKRIENEGHKLLFDNYFSSYQLLQILKSKKIFAAGTIRINRFSNPPVLGDKELKRMGRGAHDEVTSEDKDVVLVK